MAIPELQDSSGRLTDCIYFGDRLSANVGSGFVPNARTISTTAPLTGGGDLSNNRTFAITAFAGSTPGSVPTSLGGVVNFLRADGSWATPPTFGAAAAGYAPASGGGSTNYLRADGTWAAPAGTGISGLSTGRLTIATGATAIGSSRVAQGTGYYQFWTSDDGAGTYAGLVVTEQSVSPLTIGIKPHGVTLLGGVGTDAYLYLEAISGAAYLGLGPGSVSVGGALTFPEMPLTLANGANNDIALPSPRTSPYARATGPTGAFSIGGFTKTISASVEDSEIFYLYNTTSQPMTILNEAAASTAGNRILTGTGGDVVLPATYGVATFIYSQTDLRWILASSNPVAQYPRTLGYVPYQNSTGNLADSTLFHDSANNRYGFGTATPKATVDVNGTLATKQYAQALSNGLNSDIVAPTTSYCRITGPTGAFSVGGFAIVSGENGKRLTLHNTTSQAMTIVNEDASSTAANRITTLVGADVVFPARQSLVHLIYNSTTSRWVLEEANPVVAGGATTQVQSNLSGSLYGDSGLVVAGTGVTKSLTLGTDVVFSRKTTRQLEMGIPAALAKSTPYIITGTSARGGIDSNRQGGDLSIGGGAGTGAGGGGNLYELTAYPGSIGNTQDPFTIRKYVAGRPVALTSGAAVTVVSFDIANGDMDGGTLHYTIRCTDGSDIQIIRGSQKWAAINVGGTITTDDGTPDEAKVVSGGTLTVAVAASDATGGVMKIEITATTSLTPTTLEAWLVADHDGVGAIHTV